MRDKKQEVLDMIRSDKSFDKLMYLKYRWDDEKEYEDWADYEKSMAAILPKNWSFVKGIKRPFGFIAQLDPGVNVRISLKFKGDYAGLVSTGVRSD